MNKYALAAFWDELEKIARALPAAKNLATEALGVLSKRVGRAAPRIHSSGRFIPGATRGAAVAPALPSHADRARRMLASNPELAKKLQAGMGGEIQSAHGVLTMALRGSGGRGSQAIQRAHEIGNLNTKLVADVRKATAAQQAAQQAAQAAAAAQPPSRFARPAVGW